MGIFKTRDIGRCGREDEMEGWSYGSLSDELDVLRLYLYGGRDEASEIDEQTFGL